MKDALQLLKEFCKSYFEERNVPRTLLLLADDICWLDAARSAEAHDIVQARAYMEDQARRSPAPCEVAYADARAMCVAPEASAGFLCVTLTAGGAACIWNMTAVARSGGGTGKLCSIHMSPKHSPEGTGADVPPGASGQEEAVMHDGLFYEVFSGGRSMRYREEGYPAFYIDRSLWRSLGYASEDAYRRRIGGLAAHSMHPDDRAGVCREIESQLAQRGKYSVEYRKWRQDGAYTWVHEYGRAIVAPNGRAAMSCVLYDISDKKTTQAQLDNLIRALPGGVARYRYKNGVRELLYQSEGVGPLVGRTAQEYRELVCRGLDAVIFHEDVPLVVDALERASASEETVSVAYRALHERGGVAWINASFRRTGFEEDCTIVHAVFMPLPQQSELYHTLAEESGCGIVVRDAKSYALLYINKAACAMLQVAQTGYAGRKCHEYFNHGDKPCVFCAAGHYRKGEMTPASLYVPEMDKHFSIKGTVVDWAGREAIIEYMDDVTALEKSRRRLDDLLQNVPCGLCLYKWDGVDLTPVIANANFLEMLGEDAVGYLGGVDQMQFTHVHADDLDALRQAVRISLAQTHCIDHTYRSRNLKTDKYLWLRMRGTALQQPDKSWLIYVSYFDVTQEHEREQKLRESENLLEHATEHAGLWYWRYDAVRDIAYMDIHKFRALGLAKVMENFLETFLSGKYVDADYAEVFRDACLWMRDGERQVTFEARLYGNDGSLHWARLCFTNLFDGNGKAIIAVCTAVFIDNEKEILAKYRLEKRKPALREKTLLAHALFNLTTGATLEYLYRNGDAVPPESRTVFIGDRDNLDRLLIDDAERERYRALNDRVFLMGCYDRGETELSIDYRRRIPGGDVIWVRNILHLVRDPDGSGLLLFEYCYDVEDEKMRELMYRSLVTDSYDYVAKINGKNRRYSVIHRVEQTGGPPFSSGEDADLVSRKLAESALPEDRERMIGNTLVEGIREHLRDRERFQFTCRVVGPDGDVRYKKITQYYIDRQREILVMIREDVTSIIQAEADKNAMLVDALEAANQASRAKSQFLSRMSHELRTPMNAIIGLSVLAAPEVGNPAVMRDTIGKIDLSARYLMSLINDILEMSRIESGCVTLNEGSFDFAQLIASVHNIVYSQAVEKGLEYNAVVNGLLEPTYVGDATKLQQILVNVLGNAVKFTPAGGRVTFSVEQLRRTGDCAVLRFVVRDTGIGIDEAFLPYMFDAFSQESASFTSASAGTGLGLAIAKSMVEMMNGQIQVQSVRDVGSVFTIEVRLGICADSRTQPDPAASMPPAQLKVLLVDDDATVFQSVQHILSNMGMKTEWVDSGRGAIARAHASQVLRNDFDAILIDWKMPDLDGIETARQIRRIVGADAAIILLTPCNRRPFEEAARRAGVDMFLEKPLLRDTLVKALEEISAARRNRTPANAGEGDGFAGRRFLLAEDHPLNVEVVRRLLEKAGAEVVVANNGFEALKAFAASDDHYFDAILMDLRMPVMDGLTAAKNIRNLNKAGSQTIPIVATTANAFDEDVRLSMASGMDAHLIKPIDPQMLFATLRRLLPER